MLKNTQLVTDEISEDMASAKEELDQAVPFHTLLDVSDNFCEISEDMASAKEDLDLAIPSHTLLDVSGIPNLCLMNT